MICFLIEKGFKCLEEDIIITGKQIYFVSEKLIPSFKSITETLLVPYYVNYVVKYIFWQSDYE